MESRQPEESPPADADTETDTVTQTGTARDAAERSEAESRRGPEAAEMTTQSDPEDQVESTATPAPGSVPDTAIGPEAVTEAATDPETVPESDTGVAPETGPGPDSTAWTAPYSEATGPCAAGLFGKLPARGDFISRAISPDLLRPLEDWLLPLVQATREVLGEGWNAAWRQAPPWRFWIGPDILPGDWTRALRDHERAVTVTGVLLPSADRQGRLFPLMLVLADEHARLMPPPVLDPPDRGWYAGCDRLLLAARAGRALEAVEADLAGLAVPRLPEGAAQMAGLLARRALWGQGGGEGDGNSTVWSGIRASDHHLASTGRSYWWCEAATGRTSVISLAGLPDAETFAFMLTDAIPSAEPLTGA